MKTYSQKLQQVERIWYLIDAASAPFGRVATAASSLLLGKGKPTLTPHTDGGDFVVIINAANLVATGGKETKKLYYRHSGYPGGIYKRTLGEEQKRNPTAALHTAIRGMLPDNKLRSGRLKRLKIYEGSEHNHSAQNPRSVTVRGTK